MGCYKMWPVHAIKNINFLRLRYKQITLLIRYATKMVRNYISNDIDLVQPTQYPNSKNWIVKKPPPEPKPLPPFNTLPIFNENE